MAHFKIRREAEEVFFKHVVRTDGRPTAPLSTKFDLFYLCLMMGLQTRRTSSPGNAPGFIDYFVADYKAQEMTVVGLLLCAELERDGVSMDDRPEVKATLARFVGSAGLTDDGVTRLNEYASGGYDALVEQYGGVPYSWDEFLPWYVTEIGMTT